MTQGVHSFTDMYQLFGAKEPSDMGFMHKSTPEKLDKIIQFIWLHQRDNDGASPSQTAIANEIEVLSGSISWFINMLVNDDRLEKISSRPYRVRILEHPKNKAAIRRLEKALAAAEAISAGKPELASDGVALSPSPPMEPAGSTDAQPGPELPAPVEHLPSTLPPTPEARLATAHRAFADSIDPVPARTRSMSYHEAKEIIARHGGDLDLIAGAYILNTAKPGDLLEQLLERGYTVAKTNPKWR